MKIIVQGHEIETQDIWDIVDIEKDKKMFLNREAGFIIKLVNGQEIRCGQKIPYESYPSEIYNIKDKWRKLEKEVEDRWKADKSEIPVFKI